MEDTIVHTPVISFEAWRHVFKLDPDKDISDDDLDLICLSGTDAIAVGGSSGVTFENTVELMSRIRRYELPVALEVSNLDSVVPGFDAYLIPMVLNTSNPDWMIGQHQRAIQQYGDMIPWELLIPEGYLILNPKATAAKLTEAETGLTAAEARAYAQVADKLMRLPIVYVEYSGTYGDMELVHHVRKGLGCAQLFYGGGIRTEGQAREAAEAADTVVVGNIVYDDVEAALRTVEAVRLVL
ncbi:heptaprenylglyceryl phosphate synthase [Paenibacillus popilliae]|uniref:Heptaprenylglyceryl phosphate synthase n=1 Tax=Paenibacillus popilliae ATCC 14706 TaxID=1212764 RepID=M9LMV5_PAEPP|nr:heptaprenylglyceryl phosphate synthase [Paenibacillus popilliae]GAC41556.1 predicted phosphate-binding enzymes [Paenibacillus popilliae ATCC 14706]